MTDISLASQHPSQPSAAPEPYVPARRTFAPGYLPACIRVKRRCSSVDILAWPPARVLRRTSTNQGNLGRRMIRRARSTADDRGRVRVMRRPGVVTATRRRMPIASIACLPRRGGPSAGCICRYGRSVSRSGGLHPEPVSSNPATSLAASCPRTYSRNRPAAPAARAVSAATVQASTGCRTARPAPARCALWIGTARRTGR